MIPARELQTHLRKVADEVEDAEVAGLLGLVDRDLLHRASQAILDGDSLAILELVEGLADYGADYRTFARELLLHLREILLVKLAPAGSPLLASILPEELERLRALAGALSEEDLLRGLDVLTRAEGELRSASDPRVALDLVLLKLVHMRRLMPFAEVVARVERLLGEGPAAALPSPRPAAPRTPTLFDARPPAPPRPPVAAALPSAPAGSPEALLATMIGLCRERPSLGAPLRSATARLDGQTLVIDLPPDFLAFGRAHADEYRDLAKRAAGKNLHVEISAGAAPPPDPPPAPSTEEARRHQLREEAEREPAVQEALDLFDGRVVDVREAKPSREDT
jgi:DNA polymerase-3 subunit gamma/tau